MLVGSACVVCGKSATKRCSGCKTSRYCSVACQWKHWEAGHKLECKPMRASLRSSTPISSMVPGRVSHASLHEPKKFLFPYDEFRRLFNDDAHGFPPCGLVNRGNGCFANVVLQCLASTQPLTAYLLGREDHSGSCVVKQRHDWCFLCELRAHVHRASTSLEPFAPVDRLARLRSTGVGSLGRGTQEDAHEFMRFAIDAMQSVCLDEFGGEKALDPCCQETTLIQYIFGGYLRSQVTCIRCDAVSSRYENMMDLTVEIQGDAKSLEECLDQFTSKEQLDGENMYKCDNCDDYVMAWKRLTIHRPPNILTIALKRFQNGRFGKLNKRVAFPEILDITPYMSGIADGSNCYVLYAVIVHVDMLNASFFGHYISYTKGSRGYWYRIDDSNVVRVEVEEVLAQNAYMVLYSRTSVRQNPFMESMDCTTKRGLPEICTASSSIPDASDNTSVEACRTINIANGIEEPKDSALHQANKSKHPFSHALLDWPANRKSAISEAKSRAENCAGLTPKVDECSSEHLKLLHSVHGCGARPDTLSDSSSMSSLANGSLNKYMAPDVKTQAEDCVGVGGCPKAKGCTTEQSELLSVCKQDTSLQLISQSSSKSFLSRGFLNKHRI